MRLGTILAAILFVGGLATAALALSEPKIVDTVLHGKSAARTGDEAGSGGLGDVGGQRGEQGQDQDGDDD
jgi:hypothetical protein